MNKSIICTLLTLLMVTLVKSQDMGDETQARNEIKLNASNLIAFTFLDVSYEAF